MKAIIIYMNPDNYNEIDGGIYSTSVKFPGMFKVLYNIPLSVNGKTYEEKKEDLRNKAIEYQNSWYDYCGFSYGEIATISEFFEKYGKRYGLLREFHENGIC